MEPNAEEPKTNVSYQEMIKYQPSKTGSIALGSGQQIEEPITTFVEILASYINPLFTDPIGQPLIDPPSTRYVDAYSSYTLTLGSTTTQYFSMNPPLFGFPKGLGSSCFSTTPVVDTTSASYLPEK
jgi:hypothetical protein